MLMWKIRLNFKRWKAILLLFLSFLERALIAFVACCITNNKKNSNKSPIWVQYVP